MPGTPAGYPRDFECRLTVDDGREILVRPILPSDADELRDAIRTADADTLHQRFLTTPPRLTPATLAYLTTIDYVRRFALIGVDPATGRGVAIARYESVAPGEAEVAVAVDPHWRRVGLATILVELLARAATERGIHTFTALSLAENRPVAHLETLLAGMNTRAIRQGIAEFAVALDPARLTAAERDLDSHQYHGDA